MWAVGHSSRRAARALVLFLALALWALHGAAEETTLSRFGFQGVMLNMHVSQVPSHFKTDCGSGGDKRFLFCTYSTTADPVPLTVELSFYLERVAEINVYFLSDHFETLWMALREKYGKEDRRDGEKVEWYSNPMAPDQPVPDEIVLRRKAANALHPGADQYKAGVQYGDIHYESLALVRDGIRKRQEERELRVKAVADKL